MAEDTNNPMENTKGRNQNGEEDCCEEHCYEEEEDCCEEAHWRTRTRKGARKNTADQEEEGEEGEKNAGCTDQEWARKKKVFF